MTTYTVAFPKGGTTKTTTAAELVHQLAARGRQVLAIDLDEQGTLTHWLGFTNESAVSGTTAGVLTGCADILSAATSSPSVPGAYVLVGTHDLGEVDTTQVPDLVTSLRDLLPEVKGHFDDVVIDAPPTLSGITLAALAAADVVIAPLSCEGQATDQLARFEEAIHYRIARRVRRGQRIHAIIPTRYDGRRVLDRDVVVALKNAYGRDTLVTGPVREGQVVKESYVAQKPLGLYAPESRPALDYARILAGVIERNWS